MGESKAGKSTRMRESKGLWNVTRKDNAAIPLNMTLFHSLRGHLAGQIYPRIVEYLLHIYPRKGK